MTTLIRASISVENKYYISKERYYELKHFCLQYPEWKKAYSILESSAHAYGCNSDNIRSTEPGDPTAKRAIRMAYLSNKIELVEKCAKKTDPDLSKYILKAVTEGYSYTYLSAMMDMPASRNMFYDRYRRFFWILNQMR